MLYSSINEAAYAVNGVSELDAFARSIADYGAGDVIHMQWTNAVSQTASDATEAWRRFDIYTSRVDAARRRGAALVWTVHNTLSHDLSYPAQELALCKFLAKSADAVHIMNPATVEAVSSVYEIPSHKVSTIAHSSYLDIYPQDLSRREARARLGIADADTAVLFLGQMRPYKGLDVLLPALSRLGERRDNLVLLLAGKTHPADAKQLEDLMPTNVRVERQHTHVEDSELQQWFGAADVTALPYRAILNTGSARLSATFGVPVLLPDMPTTRAQFDDEEWVRFFDADSTGAGLERALSAVEPLSAPDPSALAFARATPPAAMAAEFEQLVARVRAESLWARLQG